MSPEMGWGALRDPVPWGTPAAGLPQAPRHAWRSQLGGTGWLKAGEQRGEEAPQPRLFPAHFPLWTRFTTPCQEGAQRRRYGSSSGAGRGLPISPRGSSLCHLPTPSCSFSSFPFQPFLSPAFLPFPLLSAPLPSVHPRVIYFFPWQLYNPFPCLTAIKQMLRFQSHGP